MHVQFMTSCGMVNILKWYSLSALLSLLLFYLPMNIKSYIYASVFLLSFRIFSIYIDMLRVVITNVFLMHYICIILSVLVYLLIIYALAFGLCRHRWTGRYEAHLWDNSCRREGQSRKGRQGNEKCIHNNHLYPHRDNIYSMYSLSY